MILASSRTTLRGWFWIMPYLQEFKLKTLMGAPPYYNPPISCFLLQITLEFTATDVPTLPRSCPVAVFVVTPAAECHGTRRAQVPGSLTLDHRPPITPGATSCGELDYILFSHIRSAVCYAFGNHPVRAPACYHNRRVPTVGSTLLTMHVREALRTHEARWYALVRAATGTRERRRIKVYIGKRQTVQLRLVTKYFPECFRCERTPPLVVWPSLDPGRSSFATCPWHGGVSRAYRIESQEHFIFFGSVPSVGPCLPRILQV